MSHYQFELAYRAGEDPRSDPPDFSGWQIGSQWLYNNKGMQAAWLGWQLHARHAYGVDTPAPDHFPDVRKMIAAPDLRIAAQQALAALESIVDLDGMTDGGPAAVAALRSALGVEGLKR